MERERELKMEPSAFNRLILEVAYHYFGHILWASQTNPLILWEETRQGCEYQEVGIIGGPFGS